MEDNKENLEQEVQNTTEEVVNNQDEVLPTIDETIQSEVGDPIASETPSVQEEPIVEPAPEVVPPVVEQTVENVVPEVEAPVPTLEENGPVEEAVRPVASTENEYEKNKKKNGIIAIVCAVIIIILGLVFAYTKFFSAKNIFTRAVDKKYSDFEKWLDNNWDESKSNKSLLISQDVKVKIDGSAFVTDQSVNTLISEINKLELKTKVGIDSKNSNVLMNIDTLYDNSELLVLGAYLKDNKYYLELKNLYDKYIEISDMVELEEVNVDVEKSDVKYVLSSVEKSFTKNLNDKDFKKSKETITVNGKKVKVSKITYNLSQKTIYELSIKMLEDLKNDSKFIKILSKISGTKEAVIKDSLKDAISDIKDGLKDADTENVISLSTYVKGLNKKYIGFSSKIKGTDNTVVVNYFEDGDVKQVDLSSDETKLLSITEKDNTTITISSNNQEYKLSINKKESGKNTTYTFNLKSGDTTYLTGTLTDKEVSSTDSKQANDIALNISFAGVINIDITDSVVVEYKDKLDLPDTTNSIKIENITEQEQQEIMVKLYKNEGFQKLINNFGLLNN